MRKFGMSLLLILLVAMVFVVPAILPYGRAGRFVLDVLMTFLLLAGVLAVAEHSIIEPALVVLSILTIVVRWAEWIVPSTLLPAVRELSALLALLVLAVAVGTNVFGGAKAVADRITGAVVLYLLIGLVWAVAYGILDKHLAGAFTGASTGAGIGEGDYGLQRWVYFSFVTLTTVGYGDISPVARAARSLAILEALIGQLYPAVILARLVSLPRDGPPPSGDTQR
jgi:hypothetical protein